MKVEAFKCDGCETLMNGKESGFAFDGNVSWLDGGGLIGNNIAVDGKVNRTLHYCTGCTIRILGLQHKAQPRELI